MAAIDFTIRPDINRLRRPFPTRIHPRAEELEQQTASWVAHHGLLPPGSTPEQLAEQQYTLWWAMGFPDVPIERLRLGTDLSFLFFLVDDAAGHGGEGADGGIQEILSSVSHVILGATSGIRARHPRVRAFEAALHDVWDRTLAISSLQWQERTRAGFAKHIEGLIWESRCYATGSIPLLADYLPRRYQTSGAYWALLYTELLCHIEFSPEILASPLFQALTASWNGILCWFNEIWSLPKELHHGDTLNLVVLLQRQLGGTVAEAVEQAVHAHNDEIDNFLRLRDELYDSPLGTDPELHRFIQALENWISANVTVSLQIPRYNSPGCKATREAESDDQPLRERQHPPSQLGGVEPL
jgi:Terpene synthase family 2, C-terminal metal binding